MTVNLAARPRLDDVFHLLRSHSSDWDNIARALKMPYNIRNRIRKDAMGESDHMLEIVISEWMERECSEVSWRNLIEALKSSQLRLLARSVMQFLETAEAIEAYGFGDKDFDKAMSQGSSKLAQLNVMLHGPPGAGKTSLKMVILNEPPLCKENQKATNIFSKAVRAISPFKKKQKIPKVQNPRSVSSQRMQAFTIMTDNDLLELLAAALKDQIDTGGDPNAKPEEIDPENDPKPENDKEKGDSDPNHLADAAAIALLKRIKEQLKNPNCKSLFLGSKWHNVIDSGGQPQFQDIFPLLHRNSSSFQIVVMSLLEDLDDKPVMCYNEAGENLCKDSKSLQLTNLQYIERMCQIVAACSSDSSSRVMIVGTRRDQLVKKVGEAKAKLKIKQINERLKKIKEKYNNVLICKSDTPSHDDIIFDINTMAEGDERHKDMMALREKIELVSDLAIPQQIPLKHFAFQLSLDTTGSGIVGIENCYDKGRAIGLVRNAVRKALVYFNKTGLLLYYPDEIPNLVLTNIDPLVDRLSELVKASIIHLPLKNADCKRLQNHGIFNKELLKHIPNETAASAKLTDEIFLKLICSLKVALKMNDTEFFLPSALAHSPAASTVCGCSQSFRVSPHQPENELGNNCNGCGFSLGTQRILPYGFFFTAVIEFLTNKKFNLEFELCGQFNHNRSVIRVNEKTSQTIPGATQLINRDTWIQVCTTSPDTSYPKLHALVEAAVSNAIQLLSHTGISSVTEVYPCPFTDHQQHYCSITADKRYLTCSEDKSLTKPVTGAMLKWLKAKSANPPKTADDHENTKIPAVDERPYKGIVCYGLNYQSNIWTAQLIVSKIESQLALEEFLKREKTAFDVFLPVAASEFTFAFKTENCLHLDLEKQSCFISGWKVVCSIVKISKATADQFGSQAGLNVPGRCVVKLYPPREPTSPVIDHLVSIKGIISDKEAVHINPPVQQSGIPIVDGTGLKEAEEDIDSLLVNQYTTKARRGIAFVVGGYGASGARVDVTQMQKAFESLNFAVLLRIDISSSELACLIKAAAEYKYPFDCKFIAFYFAGHGGIDRQGREFIIPRKNKGKDDYLSMSEYIFTPFKKRVDKYPLKEPGNPRRPCLFFFDCCLSQADKHCASGKFSIDKQSLPPECIAAFATSSGLKSTGDIINGGVWTRFLSEAIVEKKSLVNILTEVNGRVKPHIRELKDKVLKEVLGDNQDQLQGLLEMDSSKFFDHLQNELKVSEELTKKIFEKWCLQVPHFETNATVLVQLNK